jgi:signal transduction histidine kinase
MFQTLQQVQRHFLYLVVVSLVGTALLGWSIFQFFGFQDKLDFLLFLLLGSLAQIAATTATIKSKTGVTYSISPAVSLAAVPFYGPAAAILIETTTALSLWLIKPADEISWKKSLPQLAFNVSMSNISIGVGSYFYLLAANELRDTAWLGMVVPWLLAAMVNDQLNLLLLTIMLRLQYGKEFRIFTIWRENAWAIPIGILITSVGGGFLAFSFQQLGWVGISIFFLPLLLSAYAFRLYVSQMQAHMDNLENIVAERTVALKKLMQEKDAFLAVLTHDMKSPITTIHLYANMIKEHPLILEKKPHVIDAVLRSQETLLDIVNNILDLEKLQANGHLPLKKELFDYVPIAQKAVEMIQVQAQAKTITLQKAGFDRHINVNADRQFMERVLNNLLSNAIKYTSPEGTVTITLAALDNELCVKVEDSGYGIPEEDLPYVFDRFRRVSSHQTLAAGTGLGLAIVKAFVEVHGGRIEVTSKMEQGSTFTMHLPILQNNQEDITDSDEPKTRKTKGATTFISY